MNLPADLLQHAYKILTELDPAKPDEASMRRAVSASYYALFHQLKADAVDLIAPNVNEIVNHRIQRWFEHAEMKKICGRFLSVTLDQPLLSLVGSNASKELQAVCRTFIQLQDARHSADYDLGYSLTRDEAFQYLRSAVGASDTWNSIKKTAEANIFILSFLLWKNWEDKEHR